LHAVRVILCCSRYTVTCDTGSFIVSNGHVLKFLYGFITIPLLQYSRETGSIMLVLLYRIKLNVTSILAMTFTFHNKV